MVTSVRYPYFVRFRLGRLTCHPAMGQAMQFTADIKLSHYMKIVSPAIVSRFDENFIDQLTLSPQDLYSGLRHVTLPSCRLHFG